MILVNYFFIQFVVHQSTMILRISVAIFMVILSENGES